jgi:hypothetical protein
MTAVQGWPGGLEDVLSVAQGNPAIPKPAARFVRMTFNDIVVHPALEQPAEVIRATLFSSACRTLVLPRSLIPLFFVLRFPRGKLMFF